MSFFRDSRLKGSKTWQIAVFWNFVDRFKLFLILSTLFFTRYFYSTFLPLIVTLSYILKLALLLIKSGQRDSTKVIQIERSLPIHVNYSICNHGRTIATWSPMTIGQLSDIGTSSTDLTFFHVSMRANLCCSIWCGASHCLGLRSCVTSSNKHYPSSRLTTITLRFVTNCTMCHHYLQRYVKLKSIWDINYCTT
jgi:hypothetical protein